MSDSVEYAKMTEIPVSSCEITVQPETKKDVKKKVIDKVNTKLGANTKNKIWFFKNKKENTAKDRGFNVIHAQIVVIFVLVISILLTNIFWEDSGINVFLRGVFNKDNTASVEYTDLEMSSPFADREVSLTDGYLTATGEGAVYAPVEGKVEALNQLEDGTWEMTISHTDTFKTVISGLTYPYYEVGYSVYSTSPIGYSDGVAVLSVAMFDQDLLITDYSIDNGNIVWG